MTGNVNNSCLNWLTFTNRNSTFLRRYIKPAKEMILTLAKMESEFIHDENRMNYKELQDNINEANDLTDSYRRNALWPAQHLPYLRHNPTE